MPCDWCEVWVGAGGRSKVFMGEGRTEGGVRPAQGQVPKPAAPVDLSNAEAPLPLGAGGELVMSVLWSLWRA